ncbi:MAG: thiamine phosphate synthase [bacterium]
MKNGFNERTIERSNDRTQLISGLYAIADSGFCAVDRLPQFARNVLEGGCRLIQLRMKANQAGQAGYDEIKNIAREIMKLKREFDFTFIINDHVDLAIESGADGVHVGENDEPVASIRRRTGDRLLIGYSAHSLEEAATAERQGADYVAFGAIFQTKTKGPGHPVQGLEKLALVARSLGVPVVAIGGIGRANIRDVVEAGAKTVAMISALAEAPDVVAEARWFVKEIAQGSTSPSPSLQRRGIIPSPL